MEEKDPTLTRADSGGEKTGFNLRAILHIEGRMGRPAKNEKVYFIFGSQLIIGREKSCDIFIPDDRISRKHALLRIDEDAVRFLDLGSTNGSMRNNEPVREEIILENGDLICLGGAWSAGVRIVSREDRITSVCLIHEKDGYFLVPQECIIGFADPHAHDVDLKIYDPSILPKHARLDYFTGHTFILSLDPQKLVLVNSKPIREIEIKNNFLIELGETLLRFELLP